MAPAKAAPVPAAGGAFRPQRPAAASRRRRCRARLLPALLLAALPAGGGAAAAGIAPNATGAADPNPGKPVKHCEPKKDRHGVWTGSTLPGGQYTLTCDPGYAVEKRRTVTLTCSVDEAQWNADPWCEDMDDCEEREYSCGPAGICQDHVGYSVCLCEHGADIKQMRNGEEVCYFKNESMPCEGRNCGAHGICVDLKSYQQSFDTGASSFRCSCETGFTDDGDTCVPVDCGKQHDDMGTWSGSTTYLGEYTLECEEDAKVLGGSQKAITLSCPADGRWASLNTFRGSTPKCESPAEERRKKNDERVHTLEYILMTVLCICGAATAAGLTMGLLSLEPRDCEIIQRAQLHDCTDDKEREKLEKQKDATRHLLPLIKDHHLLLVSLLLLNALANEALPIFLDELVSPIIAVLLSVSFVLICGEILPSALFTGPQQLTIAATFIPCVRFLLCSLYAIAKPIALLLDVALPHKTAEDELYSRPEIRAVLALHSGSSAGDASGRAVATRPGSATSRQALLGEQQPRVLGGWGGEEEEGEGELDDGDAPLDPLEAEICSGILDLGELQVADARAYRSLRRCASTLRAELHSMDAAQAAQDTAEAGLEAVAVFSSLELVKWPVDVPLDELLGVLRLGDLLAASPGCTLGDLCAGPAIPQVDTSDSVADAVDAIATSCGTPCSFAAVLQRNEFMGLLDGEEVLGNLLPAMPSRHLGSPLQRLSPKSLARGAARSGSPLRGGGQGLELRSVCEEQGDLSAAEAGEPPLGWL